MRTKSSLTLSIDRLLAQFPANTETLLQIFAAAYFWRSVAIAACTASSAKQRQKL